MSTYGPGRVTSNGVDVMVGGAWVAVEPSTVPLGEALGRLCDPLPPDMVAMLGPGDCPVCGCLSDHCTCGATDDWRVYDSRPCDPHADLSIWLEGEIPF